jgi:hypothetical protein
MTKSAPKPLRTICEVRVAQYIRDHIDAQYQGHADDVVDIVLQALEQPDRPMLDAGFAELKLAVPPPATPLYLRNLARMVWRTMLERTE